MARKIEVVKKVSQEEPVEQKAVEKTPTPAPAKKEPEAPITEMIDIQKVNHIEWQLIKYYVRDNKIIDREIMKTDVRDLILRHVIQYFRKK